ncbi:hypothetical protein E4191_09640 [Paracoccus liaowanqingii]|uniref:HlyD family efflux transporter periplasmic adaptor subunit n=1 Tax=Paracoccus liaowanqingii TaxID=2560053 RepID=A0A4P7HLA6_9RHOB|nr:hypothetical protein [Paracoccus liaowanqingii]QBX34946.1 hypothetical protein E4191_09640 [Paracoccus liaowanqingii]
MSAAPEEHRVGRRDLYHRLERTCLAEPGDPYQIIAPLDGRLEWLAPMGQAVAEGAVLARYDGTQLRRDLGLARSRSQTVATRMAQIEGPLTQARRQLQSLDLAAIERKLTEAREAHGRALGLADEGRLSEQRTRDSTEALRQVEDELTRQVTATSIFEMETELQLVELQAARMDARIAVARLEEQLEQTRIVSPVAGEISFLDPQLARAGTATIRAGTHVASVSQPRRRWSRVGMTASEADRMRRGSAGILTPDGRERAAQILRVTLREDASPWDKDRFQFLLGFDDPHGQVLIGSDIVCLFRDVATRDVLAVPLAYLTQEGDQTLGLRLGTGPPQRVVVTTGIVDPPHVEVTGGLVEGDRIAPP